MSKKKKSKRKPVTFWGVMKIILLVFLSLVLLLGMALKIWHHWAFHIKK